MVFVISGFVLMFTNFNTPPQKLNEVITTQSIDDCYDITMTIWFIEFNKRQENGANMSEADEIASKIALISFNNCQE